MTQQDSALREEVTSQHAHIGIHHHNLKKDHTQHPDAQWFGGLKLGAFFHWGISSVLGTGDLSWSMMKREGHYRHDQLSRYGVCAVQSTVTPERYWQQARDFKPAEYNPDRWLSALKEAGGTYAVLTTKHHDGFALWPSSFGGLNTKNYAGGIDLVGLFIESCRRHNLKVGLYYSPPDWYFNRHHMSFAYGGKIFLDTRHQPGQWPSYAPEELQQHTEHFKQYIRGQVIELLTRYGKIDLLWFDGDCNGAISLDEILGIQPGIVINRRGHGEGDFDTPECSFPKNRPEGWWEYCHILNDGAWGYLRHEIYKPAGWLLSEMVKAFSWGGNFLVNVGPDSQGRLPALAFARLKDVREWMNHSGRSLAQSAPEFWPTRCNAPVTRQGESLFLHMLFNMEEPISMANIPEPRLVRLVRNSQPLPFRYNDKTLHVDIPDDLRTDLVDVIEVITQ